MEHKNMIAIITGTIAYAILLYVPYGLTLAPLITAVIVAALARKGLNAFLDGLIAGGLALLYTAGAGITLSLKLMGEAGGVIVPVLTVLYHLLTPALLAGGFTIFFKGEG
ncbi:MAG: hypothetical protein F7C35_06490 [Desulfurococcales archaeon]|nr:hypothetical protein [Desulfurococcales archaeon]